MTSSGDIDIFVRPSAENAARVWRALVAFGAPLEANAARESDFAEPGIVYQIGLPPRRIDVMMEISGLSFEEAWVSRIATEVDGLMGRNTQGYLSFFKPHKIASTRKWATNSGRSCSMPLLAEAPR